MEAASGAEGEEDTGEKEERGNSQIFFILPLPKEKLKHSVAKKKKRYHSVMDAYYKSEKFLFVHTRQKKIFYDACCYQRFLFS